MRNVYGNFFAKNSNALPGLLEGQRRLTWQGHSVKCSIRPVWNRLLNCGLAQDPTNSLTKR